MPPAANIDEAIAYAEFDIAAQAYAAVESTFTNMGLWTAGLFSEATGIFKPSDDPPFTSQAMGQRLVTDWWSQTIIAKDAIEGAGIGGAGPVGIAAVVNVVVRVLYAVKYATINNAITAAQRTAVVALYNLVWQ